MNTKNAKIAGMGLVFFAALLSIAVRSNPNYPLWWINRDVVNTNEAAYDHAPAIAGQLKWMAMCAGEELATNLPGGAGTNVEAMVSGFASSNNAVPVILGQLKYVAQPFYDRLIEAGYTTNYPWTPETTDDADDAPAILGQLKYVFSFDLTADADADDLSDWWEIRWFGSVTNWSGAEDADGDGLSNAEEYTWNTDPTYHDTDGDGFSDLMEIQEGFDPTDIEDNPGAPLPEINTFSAVEMGEPPPPVYGENPYSEEEDHDRDWVRDADERIAGTNPYDSNSVLRITNTTRTMTGMLLHWPSVTDREYKVEIYVSTNGYKTDTAFTNVYSWYDGTGGGLSYTDTVSSIQVFYRLKVREKDADGDGLADWWERQYFGDLTTTSGGDTDGDGVSDRDEYADETDPSDRFSHAPLPMLSTSGKYIVDAFSNRVVLKSVNIGSWLQWEQWMLQYEPVLWTNEWGKFYGTATNAADQVEEQTAREFMINNADLGISLLATNNNGSSGVSIQTNWVNWLTESNLKFIGGLGNGDWLRFNNVNFGTGVSNLSVALAVDDTYAGQQIEVWLDATNGTRIGVVTAKSTGPARSDWAYWCALTEQTIPLTNITGTHTVYFVGKSTVGDVANVYRFRFWRDPNTRNLFETFRDKYFTTNDLDTIRALGYNCIRLPFFHNLLEDEAYPYTYKTSGWSRLDWVLSECAKRRIWVIIDLHSTPGGQNPYHASGLREPFRNRMWTSESYKDRTEKLWAAIASRYATNPVVAGYDIFNEPDPSRSNSTKSAYQWAFSNSILPMVTRVHKAIRSNDTAHILFLESNMMYTNMWDDAYWWPEPLLMGWTNVAYEFHVYDQTVYGKNYTDDWWFSTQKGICDSMIRGFTRFSESRQTPVYVGEFAPWDEHNMEYWIRQCEANDLHWGHWNYRSWGWDDPTTPMKGKTVWGLDYRSAATTNQKPRLTLDALGTLSNKFAQYASTNYTANPHLQKVVQNNAKRTNTAGERCEFYLNTFDCVNVTNRSDWRALPWKKLTTVGSENKFRVQSSRADFLLDGGPLLMRFKSRDEADARFEANDSEGAKFSIDVTAINAASDIGGADAEIRLSALRDEITSPVKTYDAVGIVVRFAYDVVSNSVTLYVDAKNGGTNTFGTELYQSAAVGFVGNATLMLSINQTNASIDYNGANLWTGAHGLDLAAWPNGAVAAVEVERMSGSVVTNVVMDNFKAWRETARVGIGATNTFAAYPDGITLLSEPEQLTVREYYANSWKSESFVTNGEALWIPEESANGGSWLNPRVDYQNDVRLNTPVTNVVELRVAYSQFRSTNFYAKISFMPEFFPGELYWVSGTTLPYLQVQYQDTGAHAGNLLFDIWRHTGPGTETWVFFNDEHAFVPGQVISYQLSTNMCRVYYGTNMLINYAHGVNITNAYRVGTFPHLEFQNKGTSTNVAAWVGSVSCRQLPTWTPPEP